MVEADLRGEVKEARREEPGGGEGCGANGGSGGKGGPWRKGACACLGVRTEREGPTASEPPGLGLKKNDREDQEKKLSLQ